MNKIIAVITSQINLNSNGDTIKTRGDRRFGMSENNDIFITEEEILRRNPNKPRHTCFINTIIGCILITLVSLDMASRFSLKSGRGSTNYSSPLPRFDAESCPCSFYDGQTNSKFPPSAVLYPMSMAVSPSNVHQVFLKFRGEQLRYNFLSHVTDALERHGIKFFIDKYEQRGKDLKHLLVRIEESSIALAIFSSRYPESRWCMDELVMMKKLVDQGKLRVIPIFYKVTAEEVKKPTRDNEFGRNFWRLAELVSTTSSSRDQIKHWLEALESICDKMGLSSEESSESDFVYKIVKEVKTVKEAIDIEEEEKSFWGEILKIKVRNFQFPTT